jgi:hypothetical protein
MRRPAAKLIATMIVVACVSAWWAAFEARAARVVRVDAAVEGVVRQALTTWKTFTSAEWGVAVDYPPDWTAEHDGDEVTFRSPSGITIVLGRIGTDAPSEPAPGRRTPKPECTTTTTAHDVAATVCVDARSLARRAVLILKTRDGRRFRLALRTRGHDSQVFDAMLASVRLQP